MFVCLTVRRCPDDLLAVCQPFLEADAATVPQATLFGTWHARGLDALTACQRLLAQPLLSPA